jgi:DNA modification methylase
MKTKVQHKIIHGDALSSLKKMEAGKFDLIITSPPYNIGKEYEKKKSIKDYLSQQEIVIKELHRLTSSQGSVCWQVGNYVEDGEIFPLDVLYYELFKKFNFKLRNRIIWHFGHGLHCSKRFSGRYEVILWFSKNDKYIFNLDEVRVPSKYPGKRYFKGAKKGQFSCNPKGKNPSDVWEILIRDWTKEIWDIPNVKANHPEKTIHPCQYPIELVERCVLALTDKNSWVLDPYAGVGSTVLAALKNERNSVCVEKEKKYVEVIRQKIDEFYRGELKVRPIEKPIHVPSPNDKITRRPEDALIGVGV